MAAKNNKTKAAKNNKTNGNGSNGNGSNEHVSLAREEYAAFLARDELTARVTADHDRVMSINSELAIIVDMQAKRATENELKARHLERVNGLQAVLIGMLRDKTKVASMDDLSEFWRQWLIYTNREDNKPDAARVEPDIFKAWRNWSRDAGRTDRAIGEVSTRADHEKLIPKNAHEMQEHIIVRLRQQVASLSIKASALEVEIDEMKRVKSIAL